MHLQSNGIRVHVAQQGEGDLALVFLHYYGGSSRTWRLVTGQLADRYRTIATDHRGWGESQAPEGGYGIGDLSPLEAPGLLARAIDHFVAGLGLPCRTTLPRRSRRQGLRARLSERLRPAAVFEP